MSELKDKKERDIVKIIAHNVQQLRMQNDYTRDKLAIVLDCSSTALEKMEQGSRRFKYWRLVKICELFHVTIDYLFQEYDPSDPPQVPSYVVKLFNDADEEKLEILSDHLMSAHREIERLNSYRERFQ